MRTALVAAAPGAVACGGEEGTRPRDAQRDVAAAGASGAGAEGSGATGGSSAGAGLELDVPSEASADAGTDAEPYAPIPIYGGVFPDPMSRARV
jgi:hypothetical protein